MVESQKLTKQARWVCLEVVQGAGFGSNQSQSGEIFFEIFFLAAFYVQSMYTSNFSSFSELVGLKCGPGTLICEQQF